MYNAPCWQWQNKTKQNKTQPTQKKPQNNPEALTRTLVMSASELSIHERILGRFVHFSVTTVNYLIHPNFTQSPNG